MENSELIARILNYVKPYKARLFFIFLSLTVVAFSIIFLGDSLKKLINANETESNSYTLRIVFLTLIFGVGSFFRSFSVNFLSEQVVINIRADLLKKLFRLSISFYDSTNINDVMTKLTNNCELVGNLVTNLLSFLIRNSVIVIFGMGMMFYQSTFLASLTLLLFSIIIIPILFFGKAVRKVTQKTTTIFNRNSSKIEEFLSNIRLVYGFDQNNNVLDILGKDSDEYLQINREKIKSRSLFFSFSITSIILCIILVIWVGMGNVHIGYMSPGSFVAFLFYSIVVAFSFTGIFEVLSEFQKYLTASEQIFELIDIEEPENSCQAKTNKINSIESIKFSGVTFFYPSRPDNQILNDVSFEIIPGEIVGIVGKSGLGKTTLVNLLLKFYKVNHGSILINGKDMNEVDQASLKKLVSLAPQEPYIFSTTIFDNIKFANPNKSDEEVNKVAKLALIDDFTSSFKDGIHTAIGSKGIQLSGGQRQKIAIARALLRDPELLILDEATNALDSIAEAKIFENIKSLMRDKIIIAIGHRSRIIEEATKIYVVDDGHIVESGSHEELLKSSLIYKELARLDL